MSCTNFLQVNLEFYDTAGQEDYDRVRPLAYPNTDMVLIFCSVVTPSTFENAKCKWAPEIKHHLPAVPIILVGNKIDLRKDATTLKELAEMKQKPVDTLQGHKWAAKIGAHCYMECSGVTGIGINEIVQEAVKVGLEARVGLESSGRRKKKGKKCRVS